MAPPSPTADYFGRGYYAVYRHGLLPRARTREEAEFLIGLLRPRPGDRWLDMPCGYGRHAVEWARLRPDLRLFGGDLNAEYLREDGLRRAMAPVRCDMRRLPFADGTFHAVLNLLNSFGYFPPRGRRRSSSAEPDDRDVLDAFARVLRPSGRVVLDLANRRELLRVVREQPVIRYAGADYDVVEAFEWDATTECLLNRTQWRWRDGRESAHYRLRLYTPAQMTRMLNRAGFEIEAVHGDFDGSPFDPWASDRQLVVARRR